MRLRLFKDASPVRAALVGFALLALVLVVSINLDQMPLIGDGPEYQAEFLDAAGLQVGEEVRVAGIKVGDVTSTEIEADRVVVSFRAKGQRLGRSTRASIEIKTLLGQHFLAVSPDGSGELPGGARIPLERTSTPVQIVPTVERLVNNIDDLDTARLATAFDTLSEAMRGTAPEVRRTLDGLRSLSRTISSRDEQIQQLFANAHSVSGVVASRNTEITQLVIASNQVLEILHRREAAIHDLLVGTRNVAGELSGLVKDNEAQLGPALRQLHEVIEVLRRNDDNLNKILDRLPPYLRLFTNVAGTGPWFDTAITTPRGFAACSDTTTGGQLAGLLNPLLSRLNETVNHSAAPCLPLGPGANFAPSSSSGGHR